MNPFDELKKMGYRFWVEEGLLQYEFRGAGEPAADAVRPLFEELKKCKAEVLASLKNKDVIDFAVEAEKIGAAIERRGMAKIYSNALGEAVYFAADEHHAKRNEGGAVVYTLSELRGLVKGNITRGGLRQIHAAKKVFGGMALPDDSTKNEKHR